MGGGGGGGGGGCKMNERQVHNTKLLLSLFPGSECFPIMGHQKGLSRQESVKTLLDMQKIQSQHINTTHNMHKTCLTHLNVMSGTISIICTWANAGNTFL